VNLARVCNVLVNTDGRDIGSLSRKIMRKLRTIRRTRWKAARAAAPDDGADGALVFPDGMRVRLSGEYSRMINSFRSLGLGLVLASVLIYLLLVALFRSFFGPLIILFAIPLGLIGVLAMLFVTRTTLNVQSCMGVIFMVGIVVANGVLLVDFANKQRRAGAA